MSGAKSGEVSILPIGLAAGAVAAGTVIVVGGVATVVSAAVNAYLEARERIKREREIAVNEQRSELQRARDEWIHKMAALETEISAPPIPTRQNIIDDMVGPITDSEEYMAADVLKKRNEGSSQPQPPSVLPRNADAEPIKRIVDNIQELLDDLTFPLPKEVTAKLERLHAEKDLNKVASDARDIRIAINREMEQIRQERAEAKNMLNDLPPDFPEEARSLLTGVSEGNGRFDKGLRDIIAQTLEQLQVSRQRVAARILSETLFEMGYEVEPVGESIFTQGGKIHLRRSDWEDGYCVRMSVNNKRVHFNMVKDKETSKDTDETMERGWKAEFDNIRARLDEKGIQITNVKVNSEPGSTAVPVSQGIPIETKKKKKRKSNATAQQHRREEEL